MPRTRWELILGRSWIDPEAAKEAETILRDATADRETMQRIVTELKAQIGERTNSTRAEVDSVFRRFFEDHPDFEPRGKR